MCAAEGTVGGGEESEILGRQWKTAFVLCEDLCFSMFNTFLAVVLHPSSILLKMFIFGRTSDLYKLVVLLL